MLPSPASAREGNRCSSRATGVLIDQARAATWWVVVADFDQDGNSDLLVTWETPPSGIGTSVLLSDGHGQYREAGRVLDLPVDHGDTTGNPFAVYAPFFVADVNADGAPDLVALAHYSLAVVVNHGDGTFAGPLFYEPAKNTNFGVAAAADFYGEGAAVLVEDDDGSQHLVRRACQ